MKMELEDTLYIKELDLDAIYPMTKTFSNPQDQLGGSKIAVIGKPGSGKSVLIKSILWAKKHIFPCGVFCSGSEENKADLQEYIPNIFIHNEYSEQIIKNFQQRQKFAKKHLKNPWAVCLLDDCTDDPKIFNSEVQHGIIKRGRHWNCLYIISLQYGLDLKSGVRNSIDGTFILREPSLKVRKTLWENFASIIPDFKVFCTIMDRLTEDYTAVFINNRVQTNKLEDCVFYYRANKAVLDNFKFGSSEIWKFHNNRYESNQN